MRQFKGLLALILLKLVARLPLSLSRALGRAIGRAIYRFERRPCRVARTNLALCCPSMALEQREQLCRQRMLHMGQTVCETPRLWRQPSAWLDRHVTAIEGVEHFESTLASDDGTVFLVPHQGNWELVGLWLAARTAMTSLYEPPKLAALEDWIKGSRERSGATLVPTNSRGVAALLKALKSGQAIGVLPDQQPPESGGAYARLFGVSALTMTLVHKLLQRCNANVVFCAALRDRGGWRLHFLPADCEIHSDCEDAAVGALNRGVEQIANLQLSQYQWEYKRFRSQTDGGTSIYDR
jgi:KDO2-lipid IV(A) lauroyltransferase